MSWGESRGLAEAQLSLLPCKDPNSLSLIALLFGRRTKIRDQYSAVSGAPQWSGDEYSALPHDMQRSQRQRKQQK